MKKFLSILGLVFLIHSFTFGQTVLVGTAIDSANNEGIFYLQIALYELPSEKFVNHTYTEDDGHFELAIGKGVFELRTRSFDYLPTSTKIIVLDESQDTIFIKIPLKQNSTVLEEISVTEKRPGVLYKGDTVIYNVESWIKEQDTNLESVLARMPGLKIDADGEIKFEGKDVQHVLINGKKVTDVGAGILTKTLQANQVASVEIRKKEQNNKLKSSLLDNQDILVLDIKLKKNVGKDLFGVLKADAGFIPEFKGGAYGSVFSLHKKWNLHFMGESNRFGQQTIKLKSIKNLGREAFQKIFEIPADYQRLTEKEEFTSEIYSFNNYLTRFTDVGALSLSFNPSKAVRIFAGSYLSKEKQSIRQEDILNFENTQTNKWTQNTLPTYLNWKNKFDFLYQKNDFRLNYTLNYVENRDTIQNNWQTGEKLQSQNYGANKAEWYQKLTTEYLFNKKMGLSFNALYNTNSSQTDTQLNHQDTLYSSYFADTTLLNPISQRIDEQTAGLYLDGKLSLIGEKRSYFVGTRFFDERYKYQKIGNSDLFNGKGNFFYQKLEPYLKFQGLLAGIFMTHSVGYAFTDYSSNQQKKLNKDFLTINSDISFSLGEFTDISLNYKKQVGAFAFRNMTKGIELIDFQRFAFPQTSTTKPVQENSLEMTMAFNFLRKRNIDIILATIYGKVNSSSAFDTNSYPLTNIFYAQNVSEYSFAILQLSKKNERNKLNGEIELGRLAYTQFNDAQQKDKSATQRYLVNLVLNSNLGDSFWYNFSLKNNWRIYSFFYNKVENKTQQKIVMFDLFNYFKIKNASNLLTFQAKYAKILGKNSSSENFILSAKFEKKQPIFSYFLQIHNLLDSKRFVTETIYPSYKYTSNSYMLGRFVQVGFSYQFQ